MAARRLRAAEPATLVFAGAALFAGVALLVWLSHLTFWRDEWAFILDRRGRVNPDVYLRPFVEQLLALAIAIYKLPDRGVRDRLAAPVPARARLRVLPRRDHDRRLRLRPPSSGGMAGTRWHCCPSSF